MISNHTSFLAWSVTLGGLAIVLLFDFIFAYRNRHIVTKLRSVALWTAFYVSLAIAFGIYLGVWSTGQSRSEFFAGWLTEYSLSFDNLFVLLLISEVVTITDGPFKDLEGRVSEVDEERGKVKVLVSLFGRETPVELDFLQVRRI